MQLLKTGFCYAYTNYLGFSVNNNDLGAHKGTYFFDQYKTK